TGLDLVKWQIRTAAGVLLNFEQKDIPMTGAAIECRINAITPGVLDSLHIPGGHHVRFDTWLTADSRITPYYDSLLGKLIVYSATREEAVRKMKASLCELVINGVPTNIEEQLQIVSDEPFTTGDYDLTYMEGR
ncbi:MAG: acetyl-CoA carboxylase biotin carboxylase subunit, partial [Oscillospiraceae bacterium]|nr:acetyl-CoA carboxylase biotin carboxylase subunit [Oscillospiraceae bacterium]